MKKEATQLLDQAAFALGDSLAELVFEAQVLIHTYKVVRAGETITFDPKRHVYTHNSIGEWWNTVSAVDITRSQCFGFCVGGRSGNKQTITKRFSQMLNSQFRWLLVSGYEAYERYLKELYSILGFCDRNLWRCADYGNRYHANTISTMSLEDFRRRVRESPELTPEKIRNLCGCVFPAIQSAESKNSIQFGTETMSYRDYVDFIALLRHITVHEQARVALDDFFSRLNDKWKRSKGISQKLKALILHSDFKVHDSVCEIWLLPKSELLLRDCTFMDRSLRTLLERLSTHGHLLYKKSIEHFGGKAHWER
jgi:hypothetical protein